MSSFDFGAEYASFGDDLKVTAYEGEFTMIVKKVTPGTSPKGKQMFTVTLAFQDGVHAAKGRTVTDRLYWSPESETAARIFAENLAKMGATQSWIMKDRPTPEQIAEQMTGAVIECKLTAGEFNGQPQTRVSYRKTVSAKAAGGKSATAAAAVTLDDEPADEPAAALATAGTTAGGTENPWA